MSGATGWPELQAAAATNGAVEEVVGARAIGFGVRFQFGKTDAGCCQLSSSSGWWWCASDSLRIDDIYDIDYISFLNLGVIDDRLGSAWGNATIWGWFWVGSSSLAEVLHESNPFNQRGCWPLVVVHLQATLQWQPACFFPPFFFLFYKHFCHVKA